MVNLIIGAFSLTGSSSLYSSTMRVVPVWILSAASGGSWPLLCPFVSVARPMDF